MLVMPAMFFLSKKIDLKDPEIINYARMGFITSIVMLLLMYGFIYLKVHSSKDDKEVYMPPAANPSAWMLKMMGQEDPEAGKPYKKTTIKEHEKPLIQSAIQSVLFTGAMGLAMTFKFDVHQVLVMQGVLLPVNATDNILVKKYIFGQTKNDEGGELHGNVDEEPPAKAVIKESKEPSETVEIIEETVNEDTNPTEESKKDTKAAKKSAKDMASELTSGLKKRAGKGDKNMDDIDE